MIGYEFELLVREGDFPLSKPTFKKFHAELARRGWKTKCTDVCLEEQCCNKSYIKYFNAQRFPKGHHALMIFAGHHVWLDVPHEDLMRQVKALFDQNPYTFWKQFYDITLKDGLNAVNKGVHAAELCTKLLTLSKEGLRRRGYREEQYLAPLWKRVEKEENPAQELIQIWEDGGLQKIWEVRDFN